MPDTATKTEIVIDVSPQLDDGNSGPDDLAHYVDQRFEQDVTAAMINGTELVALCGYRWVPSRDPRGRRVCKPCVVAMREILGAGA